MVQLIFIIAFAFIVQLRALHYSLLIAKNKRIISSHRILMSMIIIGIPLIGILIYHILKNSLREKEFVFFSDEFINRIFDYRR